MKKLGRNDPCHCGSGLKYKKCCLSKDESGNVTRLSAAQTPSLTELIDYQLKWPNDLHRLIAHYFLNKTSHLYKEKQIENLLSIWNSFVLEENPITKKLGVYPSALEYILCQIYDYPTTQSDLAKKYEISAATLSKRVNQIFSYLENNMPELPSKSQVLQHPSSDNSDSRMIMEQELAQLQALLEQQDFATIENVNSFLKQNINVKPSKGRKVSKKEQAAKLLCQALEEPNLQRRIKLAQDVLALDPTNGDAYNILAECSSSPKEMAHYYKQGMLVEEKQLGGEAFFKENKGHFWAYFPTRPYMRAKKGYAEACAMLDKMPEAIKHFRELLELNPNDNQGIRDLLLPAYIETMDWKSAEQLIEQYSDDRSASFNYNRILVEYGLKGKSSRLTSLIKNAVEQNPFVPAYLQGKKRLPRSMPEYMGFGDDREAIVYALINRHLWVIQPELLKLLPEKKK